MELESTVWLRMHERERTEAEAERRKKKRKERGKEGKEGEKMDGRKKILRRRRT